MCLKTNKTILGQFLRGENLIFLKSIVSYQFVYINKKIKTEVKATAFTHFRFPCTAMSVLAYGHKVDAVYHCQNQVPVLSLEIRVLCHISGLLVLHCLFFDTQARAAVRQTLVLLTKALMIKKACVKENGYV